MAASDEEEPDYMSDAFLASWLETNYKPIFIWLNFSHLFQCQGCQTWTGFQEEHKETDWSDRAAKES